MNRVDLARLYLDLLKRALTFTLWDEPPVPLMVFNSRRRPLKQWAAAVLSWGLARFNLDVVQKRRPSQTLRETGRMWPALAHTMVGLRRLDNLEECIRSIEADNVRGDLIEAGVWRGGTCIFMRGVLAALGIEGRCVFAADSFSGLPAPEPDRCPADSEDRHHTHSYLAVSEEEVRRNFERYGLLDDRVVFLKGWFKDTLSTPRIERLALMRLDGDMYSSTHDSLVSLYPKLSPGGYCIIDDYVMPGCRQAVDDYRQANGISDELLQIDWTGRFWRKS